MSGKTLGIGIIMAFSFFLSGNIVYAQENNENSSDKAVIYECINNECSIDALYEMRGEYSLDFENNYELIEAIDNRLEELGVEEISYNEVVSKLNNSMVNSNDEANINTGMARVALNPSTTVKWTTTRQTTVFNGKTYELQIIRGVPATANSELWSFDAHYIKSKKSATAIAQNVIGITVSSVSGALPVVGGGLTAIQTMYDICKGVVSGMTGQTIVSDISANYSVLTGASYLYVFIKYSGDLDTGNQILGYSGNIVTYSYDVDIPNFSMNGNELHGTINSKTYSGTITAPFYNDYISKASGNFYKYNNGDNNFLVRYDILSFYLENVNDRILIKVPRPLSGF